MSEYETTHSYIQKIHEHQLLTLEEENKLAALIKSGDKRAEEKLIVSNLRLVVKIAHDFKGMGLPIQDLISEGNIGVMKAAQKFDPEKGAKFSSYAAWWIKQAMRRGLANQSKNIRIPIQSASKLRTIKVAQDKLRQRYNREPLESELVKETGLALRTIRTLLNCADSSVSIHAKIGDDEEAELGNIIIDSNAPTPNDLVLKAEDFKRVFEYMDHLSDREKLVLQLRFGLLSNKPATLEEVSQAIGRTRERVRQVQNKALNKLKNLIVE